MADYYTQFSFAFPVSAREGVDLLATLVAYERDVDPLGVTYRWEGDSFWIASDESGDVDQLAELLQKFLQTHRPHGALGFCWANTCSKMRTDSWTGGAVFITASDLEFHGVETWLQKKLDVHKEETDIAAGGL